MNTNIDDYKEIKDCIYKDEHYSARDNGAVMRHQRKGCRMRPIDNIWTFGTQNEKTGYLFIAGQAVHRIVAFAFHGNPPSDQHVVDHIDTNRANNRPENLRWLTKLENILLNDRTRKKIEWICGSVENFLQNPSLLSEYEDADRNFKWMRRVTPEEAHNCLEHWNTWMKYGLPGGRVFRHKNTSREWIYQKPNYSEKPTKETEIVDHEDNFSLQIPQQDSIDYEEDIVEDIQEKQSEENLEDLFNESLTPNAKQKWYTPTEFPCCPTEMNDKSLTIYNNNLKENAVFSSNNRVTYFVIDKGKIPGKEAILVFCTSKEKDSWGKFALCSVIKSKDSFLHQTEMMGLNKEDARHFFNLITGKEEWTEEDKILWDALS